MGDPPKNLLQPGLLTGRVQEGRPERWGDDAFALAETILLPGGRRDSKSALQNIILPAWSIWERLRSENPDFCNWKTQDALGREDSIELDRAVGAIATKLANGVAKSALSVEDDLSMHLLDRLVRVMRGHRIDLLPQSVAIFLNWVDELPHFERARLCGKTALIVSIGLNRTSLVRTEMHWVDREWNDHDGDPEKGFLIPALDRAKERVVEKLPYFSLDIERACSGVEMQADAKDALLLLWLQRMSSTKESSPVYFGANGWVDSSMDRGDHFDANLIKDLQGLFSPVGERKRFSPVRLGELIKEQMTKVNPDLVIVCDETSGLLPEGWEVEIEKRVHPKPAFIKGGIARGALLYAERSLNKLPTYRERLPDIFIRGQLKGNKPDWFPLVDSVKDFARGGETYDGHLPFVAQIDPKEEVSVNLKMGLGEKEELKYGFFPLKQKSKEPVKFKIKVTVKASQGYPKVELDPLKDDEFRKANGEIVLDWTELQDGMREGEAGLEAPGCSPIRCLPYVKDSDDRFNNDRYTKILDAIADFTIAEANGSESRMQKELKIIHPNCRNGLTFGSDPEQGFKTLAEQGWNEDVEDVIDEWRGLKESLENAWALEISSTLKDWLCRVGSHFWADSPNFVLKYLKRRIAESTRTQFVEAAGRSFHDEDSVKFFFKRFLQVGKSRIEEIDAYWENRTTLGMQHWFKAASFILRTNEDVHEWIPKEWDDQISRVFKKQIECEWKKFQDENQWGGSRLPGPIQQTLLASFYILNLRERDPELFELKSDGNSDQTDEMFALALYRVLFDSWLLLPWHPPSFGQNNQSVEAPERPDKTFVGLFLWPEELDEYDEGILRSRWEDFSCLGITRGDGKLEAVLEEFVRRGELVEENGTSDKLIWRIGNIPRYKAYRRDYSEKSIQSSIGRFLRRKASGEDITIIEDGFSEAMS